MEIICICGYITNKQIRAVIIISGEYIEKLSLKNYK